MSVDLNKGNWFLNLADSIKELSKEKDIDFKPSDMINIFETAQNSSVIDKNGITDVENFMSAANEYYGSEVFGNKLSELEDFTDAFDGICSLDGYDGLSYSDFSEMNKVYYNNTETASLRKPKKGTGTSFEAGVKNSQEIRIKTAENHSAGIKPVKISENTTLEELKSGRLQTAKELTEANDKLEKAENNDAVLKAQEEVDKAQADFDEAVENADNEEIKLLKEQKAQTDEAISNQKTAVEGIKNDISSTEDEISSLTSAISANAANEPTQEQFKYKDENGDLHFNSNAFSAAHSNWESKQKDLENKKEKAEIKLAYLNSQLIDAEDTLTSLEEEKDAIETEITEALKDKENDVSYLKQALDEAKENLENVKSKADKKGEIAGDVAQLELNLLKYDEAIAEKTDKKPVNQGTKSSANTASASKNASDTSASSASTTTPFGSSTDERASSVPGYTGNSGNYGGGNSAGGGSPAVNSAGGNSMINSGGNTNLNNISNASNVISLSAEEAAQRKAGKYGINLDGKIGASRQQSTGDCWALAGINSLSYSKAGRRIIDKAIDYKDDRAIVHTCFGDYTVMYSELQTAKNTVNLDENGNSVGGKYSSGDDDVIILELAIEKLRADVKNKLYDLHSDDFIEGAANDEYCNFDAGNTLNGGLSGELIYYLTGNQSQQSIEYADRNSALDTLMRNPDNTAITGGFKQATVSDVYGNAVDLIEAHAYAIKSVDDNTVTFTNPWDSGKDITLSRDTFLSHNSDLMTTDLSSIVKDQPSYSGIPDGFAAYLRRRLH